jgi:outer membrane receptor for ferric coprogen and ferric-rhodotorulic acid
MMLAPVVAAQTARPTSASPSAALPSADTVVLTPFEVNTTRDVGFVANSSLAGGRLAGELKDTPAAYSVLTREFIDALGLADLSEAMRWAPNATVVNDDGRQEFFGNTTAFSFRGVSGSTQRNFFPFSVNYDSYNVDRFDTARGPNAILFGQGSFGGTANVVTKRAQLGRATRELRAAYGSWENTRVTLDVNQPLPNQRGAVRVNTLYADRGGWRDREMERKRAAQLAATWQFAADTQLSVEAERGNIQRNTPTTWINDSLSSWDGRTTFSALTATLPADAAARGIARNGSSTSPYLVYAPINGVSWLVNYANTMRSTANGTAVLGVPVVGPALTTTGLPLFETRGLPTNRFDQIIAGSAFRLQPRTFNVSPDTKGFEQDYKTLSAFLNIKFGRHLFLEVAGNTSWENRAREYPAVRGIADTFIDLQSNLPTGGANPGFLQPFNESTWTRANEGATNRHFRVALAALFPGTRWGDLAVNAYAGDSTSLPRSRFFNMALKRNALSTLWPTDTFRYRYYWNQASRPLPEFSGNLTISDPIAGTTTTSPVGWVLDTTRNTNGQDSRRTLRYAQSAATAKLWQGRVNLLGAVRRDQYSSYQNNLLSRRDFPADWDGLRPYYRQAPPEDYFQLQYVPKSASGAATGPRQTADVRPRDTAGVPLPQYAADRFRDDFNAPELRGAETTLSTGVVVHLTPRFSLFANYSESFNPPGGAMRITGELLGAQRSRGTDFGLRLSLLEGRLQASFGGYQSQESNQAVDTGSGLGQAFGLPQSINQLLQARVAGDPVTGRQPDTSTEGRNIRGLINVPTTYSDTRDRENRGLELEMVANLSAAWRMTFNAASPRALQTNAYADTRAWLAKNDSVLRQIVADAGVLIDRSNVATINSSIPANFRSPDADAVVRYWNGLYSMTQNMVTGAQRISRLNELQVNLFSDYTLRDGFAKGLRVGGGINYRGREVIGYRGSDTIVDPSDPTRRTAIPDPSVSAYTPFYAAPYHLVVATLGYRFKATRSVVVSLDFRVDNVLDWTKPLYWGTTQRPPNGDISTPARVATPSLYSYVTPRNYLFTTNLSF